MLWQRNVLGNKCSGDEFAYEAEETADIGFSCYLIDIKGVTCSGILSEWVLTFLVFDGRSKMESMRRSLAETRTDGKVTWTAMSIPSGTPRTSVT